MIAFAADLLDWYARHGRDLPWRRTRDPYPIWLSEIMLQQTRVETVRPYYERFLARFPSLADLAAADEDDILAEWAGLGYYARARNLHACARRIMVEHGGAFPDDYATVAALPGIGPSTAGAILSSAFAQPHAILDGNVKRVLARVTAEAEPVQRTAAQRRLWAASRARTPEEGEAARDYNQAIMDLGATLCSRSRPDCSACPVRDHCWAAAEGRAAELPVPNPKRARPERHAWLALVHGPAGVLLERRPSPGIWGGLWCPPLVERAEDQGDPQQAAQALVAQVGARPTPGAAGAPLAHGFTHYRLTLHPLALQAPAAVAEDGPGRCWADPARLAELGLPAPVRRILERDGWLTRKGSGV
jgi:A/G-specific adenine glycosylase